MSQGEKMQVHTLQITILILWVENFEKTNKQTNKHQKPYTEIQKIEKGIMQGYVKEEIPS